MNSILRPQSTAQACGLDSREEFCMCCYHNQNAHIQIIRIKGADEQHFERVVFPGQRLMFQANPESTLDVISAQTASALVADRIQCHRLRVTGDSLVS